MSSKLDILIFEYDQGSVILPDIDCDSYKYIYVAIW